MSQQRKYNIYQILFTCLAILNLLFAKQQVIDYVFMLDTSGSMSGKPAGSGNIAIFPKVTNEINKYLDTISPPANVFIYPFDEGLHDTKLFQIKDESDVEEAKNFINRLSADGIATWIYRSLGQTINFVNTYKSKQIDENHKVRIHLYTDGQDNDSNGPYNLETVLKHFQLNRGEQDWLFYTTLGVTLPTADVITLNSNPQVIYQTEEENEVSPILIIDNKIPVLNFGNMWDKENAIKSASFECSITNEILTDYEIIASIDNTIFPKGMGAIIKPGKFFPNGKVDLELNLLNFDRNNRDCIGTHEFSIKLFTYHPKLYVIPDMITGIFTFDLPKTVEIKSSSIDSKKFIKFGVLDIYDDAKKSLSEDLFLIFNSTAGEGEGNIKIKVTQNNNNPSKLTNKNILLNSESNFVTLISSVQDRFNFKILSNNNLVPGIYSGRISFSGPDITITGDFLFEDEHDTSTKYAKWIFEIPKEPIPSWIWVIIIIVLIISIYFVYKILTKPLKFEDLRLIVNEPIVDEIDLTNCGSITMGRGHKYFGDSDVEFVITPMKNENQINYIIEVLDGKILLQKSESNYDDQIIGSDKIFDGDTIKFGDYIIFISSYTQTNN